MNTRLGIILVTGLLVTSSISLASAAETPAPGAAVEVTAPVAATEATAPQAAPEATAPQAAPETQAAPDAGEELSFDAVPEQPVIAAPTMKHWYDLFHLAGRFDLNYELDNPAGKTPDPANPGAEDITPLDGRLRNYHHFVFLKVSPTEKLTLEAEIVGQSYYEIHYKLPKEVDIHLGKIWVPFGATPFHHYYGGRQGDPFQGLILPVAWAELGAAASYRIFTSSVVAMDGDTYVIRGFDGTEGNILALNGGASDGRFAIGQRLHLALGQKVSAWGSLLYQRWGIEDESRLVLWGGDLTLDYGLIPVPFLKDLSFRGAFVRADVRDATFNPELNDGGWYWRYGDYFEVNYGGLRRWVTPRLRYGTVIDYNQKISTKDNHNWELAARIPITPNFSVLAAYQWNMEEIEEIDNDLLRIQAVVDF